ncbi:mechanosensitive ion channel family protein [Exilibacterium tricleocarpae]|uniref:Small-conductance mechanosensitive channel n=1 Tax=Exilibacterium tricleocarpae TaxID=2591008 RepID=A0A545TNL0_9GAMM|nr:mechanosensitive ion channel family protein [Exilibacterium tricleocarpae]TQV78796.1 mechanosensitive ion channel family protein [Exilibacterium tricleocarpae]
MEQIEVLKSAWDWSNVLRALILVVAGFFAARLGSKLARYLLLERLSHHALALVGRGIFWLLFSLFLISGFHQLGFKLSVLLGAAGILSVALGFASQTSASNLISGLFVLGERSFSIGDIIQVGTTTGEVLSVDLLSVKLRTFDNLYVRIPNETMIKSEVTTLTKYPIRRFDLLVGIAYKSDIAKAREVLLQVAERNLLCLEEPKPLFILKGFGNSSIDIQFSVWTTRENWLALRNSIQEQVKQAFDDAGIEIPFPHVSLYTGAASAPFPITLVDRDEHGRY